MKRGLKFSKKELREYRHRERVLNNFYTKEIKKGKTTRAVIIDKIAAAIGIFIALMSLLNRLTGNFLISLFFSVCATTIIGIYGRRVTLKYRDKKIEEFKKEYKAKLEEEKKLSPDEDLEDYLMERYYEKKQELKTSIDLLSRDKIFKFYTLFVIFYLISFFVAYPLYYKIMAVIAFVIGTIIGAYNLTEYFRDKDSNDLLRKDIDV